MDDAHLTPDGDEDSACRLLIDRLLGYAGTAAFDELLLPWIDAHPGEPAWLAAFAARTGTPVPPATLEERWRLYALSRLCELLREATWGRAHFRLTPAQFHAFAARLGLDVSEPADYAPFHHEIVRVQPAADPYRPPRVLAFDWPCLMLGDMLFMRAGVEVEAGSEVLRPGIADGATLYWTYARDARPTHDLAHGWGSNSAWRSAFRRDYRGGADFHFNVDGTVDLACVDPDARDEYGLTRDERIELLVNRSFVTSERPHDDLFPYDERVTLPARPPAQAAPPWWKRFLG
jgi:hypothetical protein